MRVSFALFCIIYFCNSAESAIAAPKCPPGAIKLDLLEFGIFFKSERGTAAGRGIDRDLVNELSKRSGCLFDAKVQPRARTLIELKAGRKDMMLTATSTPEREEYLWSFPYARMHHIVLLGPSTPATINSLDEFNAAISLKFGAVRGFRHNAFYDPLIAAWNQSSRVKFYVDEAHLINALLRGEVAAVISNHGAFKVYLDATLPVSTVRVVDWDKSNLQVLINISLSKANFSQAEAQEWGILLKEIQQDGSLLKIFQEYVGKDEAKEMLP